jgi:histidinol-phosphate aminotransferase
MLTRCWRPARKPKLSISPIQRTPQEPDQAADLERLVDGLRGAILVLDGAYAEYVDGYDAGKSLVRKPQQRHHDAHVSKIYGLGDCALAITMPAKRLCIDAHSRAFNLSAPLAAAKPPCATYPHRKCRTDNAKQRTWMAGALANLPSDTSTAIYPRAVCIGLRR